MLKLFIDGIEATALAMQKCYRAEIWLSFDAHHPGEIMISILIPKRGKGKRKGFRLSGKPENVEARFANLLRALDAGTLFPGE